MKKRTAVISILLALVLALSLCGTGVVFAYFIHSNNAVLPDLSVDGAQSDESGKVYSVMSVTELLTFARDNAFNASDDISDPAGTNNRATLVLGADIILTQDVYITADVHIDLNGKTLALGAYSLTVEHTYGGSLVISGGTVTATSGKLYAATPNAKPIVSGVTGGENIVDVTGQPDYNKYLAYGALYAAAQSLMSETDIPAPRKNYGEVSALNEIEMTSAATYFAGRTYYDDATGVANAEAFAYAARDIDLPMKYFGNKSVEITYASNNTSALSPYGKVFVKDTDTDVELTVIVGVGERTYSCPFIVRVVGTSSKSATAKKLLLSYLSSYYQTENDNSNKYVFSGDATLPKKLSSYGATFAYEALNHAGTPLSKVVTDADNVIIFSPTVNTEFLSVTINSADTFRIPVIYAGTSTITRTNESVAQEIVSGWYGNVIMIKEETESSYTEVSLMTAATADLGSFGVTSVAYVLTNNTDGTYEIVGDILRVSDSAAVKPSLSQAVILEVIVTLDEATAITGTTDAERTVRLNVPVKYTVDEADNNNIQSFTPYYNYFNAILLARTAGYYTTESFFMPLFYGTGKPVIAFSVQSDNAAALSAISLGLYYDNAEHILERGANGSYTSAIDAHLLNNNLSITELISKGAQWHFIIDKTKIPNSNSVITVGYHYKSASDSVGWTEYAWAGYDTTVAWTLPGVLQSGAGGDMPDTNLYSWVYEKFNASGDAYAAGKFIIVDWLTQNIKFDIAEFAVKPASYKGIEFLDGTRDADLSGAGISSGDLQYVAGMAALTSLDLSNNSLSDRNNGAVDAELAAQIEILSSAPSLRTLYISDNAIYSFDFLENIPSLEAVYNYSNTLSGANSIFYGSYGLANLNVYLTLIDRGVAVYCGESGGTPLTFDATAAGDTYVALTNIIYQQRLPAGASIETVYRDLSTTPSDYGLGTTIYSLDGTSSANVSAQSIVFSHEGDAATVTEFNMSYTATISGTNISMILRFAVTRV